MSDADLSTKTPAVEETKVQDKYRLHLSVPKPMARLNFGMPWYERLRNTDFESSVPKFGYKGLSAQTDSHLFIDIHKYTLFNSKKSVLMQSGKEWMQYATDSTWIATQANATFASDARMTLVAGAGQGQRQPRDHGMDPDLDAYNDLHLHYHVDSVMMGVSEFMTGRRERRPKDSLAAWLRSPWGAKEFDSEKAHLVADRREGFWDVLKEAGDFLGPGLPDLEGLYKVFSPYKEGKHHEYYGYGKEYLSAFDPYGMKYLYEELPGWQKVILFLKNATSWTKHFADVAAKVAIAVENLPVLRQASKLMKALDKLLTSADSMQRLWESFGGGEASNDDGVRFGHELPLWESMKDTFDACWKKLDEAGAGAFTTKPAHVELWAPSNEDPSGDPPYAWTKVPAGIYGWIKPDYGIEDDQKIYTFVVPGQKPERKAQRSFKPVVELPTTSAVVIEPAQAVLAGSAVFALPPAWNSAALPTSSKPVQDWLTGIPLVGRLVTGFGPSGPGDTETRITFDPSALPLFESLTLSGDPAAGAFIAALGFPAGSVEVTGKTTSPNGVSLELLHALLREVGSVTVHWELTRRPLSFEVQWTAEGTASASAAAGQVQHAAVAAGLPRDVVVAKPSSDDHATFEVAGPVLKDVDASLGLDDYIVSMSGVPDRLGVASHGTGKVRATLLETRWGDARWISVATESHTAFVVLSPDTAGSLESLVSAIHQASGAPEGKKLASAEGSHLKVKSHEYGSQAFVEVRGDRTSTLTDVLGFFLPEPDRPVVRQAGEDVSLTPDDVRRLIQADSSYSKGPKKSNGDPYPTYESSRIKVELQAKGGIKVTTLVSSEADKYSSYIVLEGKLFDKLAKGKEAKAFVKKQPLVADVQDFQKFLTACAAIPKEMGETLRPLIDIVKNVTQLVQDVSKGLIGIQEAIMGSKYVPGGPPSAIGLFAKDGITLGTPDRLVSAAGKGYVFIADGGTGQRDAAKFVMGDLEKYITNFAANEIKGFGDLFSVPDEKKPSKEKSGDGGFTVLSNSNASIVARSSVDLLAIGSLQKDDKRLGRGVARIAGTRSVEVAGHARVVVAATASKDEEKGVKYERNVEKTDSGEPFETVGVEDGKLGGEVEILGETVRVGAPLLHRGHMSLADKIPWPHTDDEKLKLPLVERAYAPPTKVVELGADKKIEASIAPFHLIMKEAGVFLGGPGGIDDAAFDEREEKELELARKHFDEQLLYWTTLEAEATEAKTQAAANVETLKKKLEGGDLKSKVEGVDYAGWKKLEEHYEAKKQKAAQSKQKIEQAKSEAERVIRERFGLQQAPGLLMKAEGEKVILGFRKANASEWGPHLKITPSGIMLAMSSERSAATIKIEEGKIELRPGDGSQAKLSMQDGNVVLQSAPGVTLTLDSTVRSPNGVL